MVHELRQKVGNSRVNNIYQLDSKTFLFKLHKTDSPPLQLVMEAGKRLHLTEYVPEKPLHPPDFCMALRKYLRGAWLRDVEQYEFERIVNLHFESKLGKFMLTLELFGDGNLILVDEHGKVVQALVLKRMRDRNILRGELYRPPPAFGRNPMKITVEDVEAVFKSSGDAEVVKAAARSFGVGGMYAEEILLSAGVEKDKRCSALSKEEAAIIFASLQNLLSKIAEARFEPRIVLDADGSHLDVVPFPLARYEKSGTIVYGTFNETLDQFYLHSVVAGKASEYDTKVAELEREAQRMKRVIAEQEQSLKEAVERVEREKAIGDTIYAHSAEIQLILDAFSKAKEEGKEWSAVAKEISAKKASGSKPESLFESFDARNLTLKVCADKTCFSLSPRLSLFDNAASFYDSSKKAKQKALGASAALEESRRKLAEIMRQIQEAEATELSKPTEFFAKMSERRVASKKWYEKFRWFKSSDGFLVVAGKDSVSNEVLVKKYAKAEDVIFHAEITGAPFVIVKTEDKAPSEQTLREAAMFAAAFSRGWREGMTAVDVYWVKPDQLSKSGPSGESVPHGAFAVVGKRNWLRGTPLLLAIGVVQDDEPHFIGGPLDAVRAQTKTYVTIRPGSETGKQFLKDVLRALSLGLSKDRRERIVKRSIEEIREFVPYAKGRVTEASP